MPRIRFTRPKKRPPKKPKFTGYKPTRRKLPTSKKPVPRADLSQYNKLRKIGYTPRADLSRYNQQRKAGYTPQLTAQQRLLQSYFNQNAAGVFSGHRVSWEPKTQAPFSGHVLSSPSKDTTGVFFNPNLPRAGEEFQQYMMDQGVVPHFNTQGLRGVPRSGRWTDYLLGRLGVTQYGVNPYAMPYTPQPGQPAGGGGYGYGGGGGGGGGGGYTPVPPKQYGSTRLSQERNLPQWLMDMVTWNI